MQGLCIQRWDVVKGSWGGWCGRCAESQEHDVKCSWRGKQETDSGVLVLPQVLSTSYIF